MKNNKTLKPKPLLGKTEAKQKGGCCAKRRNTKTVPTDPERGQAAIKRQCGSVLPLTLSVYPYSNSSKASSLSYTRNAACRKQKQPKTEKKKVPPLVELDDTTAVAESMLEIVKARANAWHNQ